MKTRCSPPPSPTRGERAPCWTRRHLLRRPTRSAFSLSPARTRGRWHHVDEWWLHFDRPRRHPYPLGLHQEGPPEASVDVHNQRGPDAAQALRGGPCRLWRRRQGAAGEAPTSRHGLQRARGGAQAPHPRAPGRDGGASPSAKEQYDCYTDLSIYELERALLWSCLRFRVWDPELTKAVCAAAACYFGAMIAINVYNGGYSDRELDGRCALGATPTPASPRPSLALRVRARTHSDCTPMC